MGLRKPLRIGGLFLQGNIFLAPVAGYTDRVFRGLCVGYGADFTFTELVSSEALVRNSTKTLPLLARAENEAQYGIQLFGSDPDVMSQAAALLAPFRPSVIDINAGCPVPKVVKTGAGSALMKTPVLLGKIVAAVVKAAGRGLAPQAAVVGGEVCPAADDEVWPPGGDGDRPPEKHDYGIPAVTVKIRTGWDASSVNYRECAKIAREEGAALVTLHARTRAQGYGGTADWEHIARLTQELDIPVCGSGDLFTAGDAERMLAETQCAAVMFARGALGNPFLFEETRHLLDGTPYTPPSPERRIETALGHLRDVASVSGENPACRAMRAHFCHYLKGLPNAAAIRGRIVQARTVREYEEAVYFRGGLAAGTTG
jgi:tRNA-dihydrouridine synthase